MSSQFSYELDERQIRMLMQDAESEYNEAMWDKFDQLAKADSRSTVDIGSYMPKFNLSISRSIIVPVLFIILIGGLSAMLFSFVDFKKKEAIDKEIPLVANPGNIKKPEPVVTKKVSKPIEKKEIKIAETSGSSPSSTANLTTTANTTPVTHEVKKPEVAKVIEIKPKEPTVMVSETKKESVQSPERKKKKRKIKAEVLPTINATTNLNEGASEPELDLK
ncbi:MAG: hypothetical protein HY062_18240 [Bacteroidetes bacterium]|nr:hypothetical protein [Bacteroidota bacterium]